MLINIKAFGNAWTPREIKKSLKKNLKIKSFEKKNFNCRWYRFIGYHLAKKCIKKKFKVTSLSYSKPKKKRFLKKVRYLFCDISKKKKNLHQLKLKNFDYVVNLGGYVNHKEKAKTFNSHFRGCKNLADFFLDRKIKNLSK